MNLKDLILQKKELEEVANREVPENNPNANAFLGVIKRAKIDLEENKEKYIEQARKQISFIIADGSESEEFSKIAQSDFGCFTVDSEDAYKEIASNISDAYLGQSLSQHILNLAQGKMETMGLELGIRTMPGLVLSHQITFILNTRNDIVAAVKQAVNEQVGIEFNSIYISRKAAENAYDVEFTGKTLPVVVTSKDSKISVDLSEGSKRLANSTFLLAVGESSLETKVKIKELTMENVEKAFVSIKKAIK